MRKNSPETELSIFATLRLRLLLYYLIIMEVTLVIFAIGVYGFFSYRLQIQKGELDKNLRTLAQEVIRENQDFEQQIKKISRSNLFEQKQQGIEWFNAQGKLLANQGLVESSLAPKPGFYTLRQSDNSKSNYQIRMLTFALKQNSSLKGYLRVSQVSEDLETLENDFLWGLAGSIVISLVGVSLGGWWLTRKALQPAQQSYQRLKQFTADASHEFRGPLTAIQLSVERLQKKSEQFEPKDSKKLGAIASATQQMKNLTEDLLLLARTDTNLVAATSELQEIYINELLQQLVDLLEPLAQEKKVNLEYHCIVKLLVIGKRNQLSRLFSNLLQNAIQYTASEGKVTVSLSQDNYLAVIRVEDTGIGIAKEDLPLVFERFWRADKARSRRKGGTGLGLAIAQAIAQSHGGEITVSSQLGVGTCFQVVLPSTPPKLPSLSI